MPVPPFASRRLIPAGSNDPRIKPRAAILHVDAGNASSLYDYFAHRSGGVESHFFVKADGEIECYRDTDFQADANLDANDFAVSIETQGFGAGRWSDAQLDAIKRLLLWLNAVHGIPLRKIDRWDGSGVGYHTQFGAPSHWTPVAKTCPGPARIRQFDALLVPWMKTAAHPKPKTPAKPFGVASWNMGPAAAPLVLRDLARLARHARIICLQEAGDRSLVIKAFLATHPRWKVYAGDKGGGPKVPILWRRDRFHLIDAHCHVAVPPRDVVPAGVKQVGKGGARGPAQYVINHVHLRDKATGEDFHVLNTHLIASATRGDMSPEETRLRRQHYADHIAALVRVIKSLGGDPFVLTGDFNAERDFPLLAPLAELVTGWTAEDTHGNRAIDHVLHRGLKASHSLPLETSSDHAAVIATVTLKEH